MLSKNQIKLIASLQQKKYRYANHLFVVEGEKMITELFLMNIPIELLVVGDDNRLNKIPEKDTLKQVEVVSEKTMQRISSLKTPQNILALVHIPKVQFRVESQTNNLVLLLDNIRDPGNLGTIIRIADWFGIRDIVCSISTVDCYNPKVIQATMGSIFRVNVHYADLAETLTQASSNNISVYGCLLDGKNLYQEDPKSAGFIVLGNESTGISSDIMPFITHKIFIPHSKSHPSSAESLNVAVATGIICAEFRRRIY